MAVCASCSAPLPAGEGLREVTCGHCQRLQPHPEPLPAGHAVMIPRGERLTLGRVVSCEGPDRVRVRPERGAEQDVVLEALIPVVPAERAEPPAEPGERVHARTGIGFELTTLVELGPAQAVVKHPHPAFRSTFFDKRVPAGEVWVAARPERRERVAWTAWSVVDTLGRVAGAAHSVFMGAVTLVLVVVFGGFGLLVLKVWLWGP